MKATKIYHNDWNELISQLPPEKRLLFWDAWASYDGESEVVFDDAHLQGTYNFVISQVAKSYDKYESVIEKRKEAGRKSAEKRYNQRFQQVLTSVECVQHNSNDNDNDNDNDNVNDNVFLKKKKKIVKEKKSFIEPTAKEVYDFLKTSCPERFPSNWHTCEVAIIVHSFYAERNWQVKIGNKTQPMKDWKSAARRSLTWGSVLNILNQKNKPQNWINPFDNDLNENETPQIPDVTPPQSNGNASTINDMFDKVANTMRN